MLIMIVGLPGTGKTTLAIQLARQIGAVHLNSDMIRIELDLLGKYDSQSKERVYRELEKRAKQMLKLRKSVIIDATLYTSKLRKPYNKFAKKHSVPMKWIELVTDAEKIEERMEEKRLYSEADYNVFKIIKSKYEPLGGDHLTIHTDLLSQSEAVEEIVKYINTNNN